MSDTQQYLFRTYQGTLDVYPFDVNQATGRLRTPRRCTQLAHNDQLCTFPESTSDLAKVASTFVYADACLLLRTNFPAVAVFELEESKPADQTTPVTVMHPFWTRPAHAFQSRLYPQGFFNVESAFYFVAAPTPSLDALGDSSWNIQGFQSYDLDDQNVAPPAATPDWPDAFVAGLIAREVEDGPYQKDMARRAIGRRDVYVTRKGTLSLSTTGTLLNTRFPLWADAVESLKFTHSGWQLERDGSIKRRKIAQTERVLMGASDQAQQRRTFLRQPHAVSEVSRAWAAAVTQLMEWLWANELHGYPRVKFTSGGRARIGGVEMDVPKLKYQVFPYGYAQAVFDIVAQFVNLAGIAGGADWLLLPRKTATAAQRQAEFTRLLARLRDPATGKISRYSVYGETQQVEVIRGLADLAASIADDLARRTREANALNTGRPINTLSDWLDVKRSEVAFWQAEAEAWPSRQVDILGLLGLLFTWQLTWDVHRPTRGGSAADVMRNKRYTPKPTFRGDTRRTAPPVVGRAPNWEGRWATERPYYVPFRIWEPMELDDGSDEAEEVERKQAEEIERKKFVEKLQAEEVERKAKRRALRQKQIEQLRERWRAEDVPNPNDIYDYRNIQDAKWWQRQLTNEDMAEQALRALNVPQELEDIALVGRAKRKAAGKITRLKPKTGTPWLTVETKIEMSPPMPTMVGTIPLPVIRRFVIRVGKEVVKEVAQDWIEDKAIELVDGYFKEKETYSDRQIWPPDS